MEPPEQSSTSTRKSTRARPPKGAMSVSSLEQKYAPDKIYKRGGVFGGRRKSGEPPQNIFVKGNEPENFYEVSGTLQSIPSSMLFATHCLHRQIALQFQNEQALWSQQRNLHACRYRSYSQATHLPLLLSLLVNTHRNLVQMTSLKAVNDELPHRIKAPQQRQHQRQLQRVSLNIRPLC